MKVRAPKFLVAEREGPAPADGVVDLTLEHGGSVSGTVKGFDGKVPPSFRVKVKPEEGSTGTTSIDREIASRSRARASCGESSNASS